MATLDRWRSFLETPKTISLVHAELRGRHSSLLAGPGEIRMTSLQDFSYSMTPATGDVFAFFRAIEHKRQNSYDGTARFRLFGRDADGIEWGGGWTMPRKIDFKPLSVEGRLTALDITDPLATAADSTELLFYTDHLHPLARVMGRQKQKRLEILGSVIEFNCDRASKTVSITASHSSQLRPTYTERWLSQPLRIMFGQPVQPRLFARNKGNEAIIWITSVPRLEMASWSAFWTDDPSNTDSFFDCYSQLLTMIATAGDITGEAHPITRFYDELSQVANASRWVMALTLAGCSEGLAKLLRPKMNASELKDEAQWAKDAEDLACKIEKLDGLTELKNRAAKAVRQIKGTSTAGTLKALHKRSTITSDQFAAFNGIRNKVMHGDFVSPYSNENEDNQLLHLIGLMHALTREFLNRALTK